jgi:M6 family metalloprotease-like protein
VRALALLMLAALPASAQEWGSQPHVFTSPAPERAFVRAQAAGPCSIEPRFQNFLTEGSTDPLWHPPSTGTMRAVMLFVDFPDAPATETPASLYDRIVPQTQQWLSESSHGRLALEVTRFDTWRRMPLTSAAYGFNALTFEKQRRYLQDAANLADASVDFSSYDVLLVVSSAAAQIPVSPTYLSVAGFGVQTAEKELRWGVTFGNDVRVDDWGGRILAHELGHVVGLPDLYRFGGLPFPNFVQDAGGWDLMSWLRPGAHPIVWHKRKLGWIDESQIVCATGAVTEAALVPSASESGVKAIVVPIDSDTVLVAERREPVGNDAKLCDSGMIVYTVEASASTGFGPVVVHSAGSGADPNTMNRCGPIYDAPFDPGIRYADGNITIERLTSDRVRVTRAVPHKRRAVRR